MEDYLALVRGFPLVSIRDDEHLDAAIAMLHRLLDLPVRSEAQEECLGALTDLIETYESAHVPIRQASGIEVLRHLMEAAELRQKDISEIFGNKGITSQVLSGKRPIGLTAARRLSARFALPLDVFLTPNMPRASGPSQAAHGRSGSGARIASKKSVVPKGKRCYG